MLTVKGMDMIFCFLQYLFGC